MSIDIRTTPLPAASPSVLSEVALDEEKALSLDSDTKGEADVSSAPSSKDDLDGIVAAHGAFARVTRYLAQLGVETRSTERIPEDEREQVSLLMVLQTLRCPS